MPTHNAIDWEFIVKSYNHTFNSDHKNSRELLAELYAETNNLRSMDEILGVSWASIADRMDKDRLQRSHNTNKKNHFGAKIAAIPAEELIGMSSPEVAERVGCSLPWAISNLRRQGRAYNKRFNTENER